MRSPRIPQWLGIILALAGAYVLLNWRFFLIGSSEQRFLYGDALQFINGYGYLFEHFSLLKPWDSFISTYGGGGMYVMSEPQLSTWYLPTFLMMIVYKVLGLGAEGLYYLVFLSLSAHLIGGAAAIAGILKTVFNKTFAVSLIGGVLYLVLGWNIGWLSAGSLAFMTGLVPLLIWAILCYLQQPTRRQFFVLSAAWALLLFGGGIVNFLFYGWLTSALLLIALQMGYLEGFQAWKRLLPGALRLLVGAPLLAGIVYLVQLIPTQMVAADTTRASLSIDYLSFFGLHLIDLLGFVIPRLGALGFGDTANPVMDYGFGRGYQLYMGMLPLMVLAYAAMRPKLRTRTVNVLLLIGALHLVLTLGGFTPLYQLSLLFPGNTLFRGHYKELVFFGVYVALLVPLILDHFKESLHVVEVRGMWRWFYVLLGAAVCFGLAAFGLDQGVRESAVVAKVTPVIRSLSMQLGWAALFALGSIAAMQKFSIQKLGWWLVGGLLMFDGSISYLYGVQHRPAFKNMISQHFYTEAVGQRTVMLLPSYTPSYVLPNIVQIDDIRPYSALINTNLVAAQSRMVDGTGQPNLQELRNWGVTRVATMGVLTGDGFTELAARPVTRDTLAQFIRYNGDNSIQDEWASVDGYIGEVVRIYQVEGASLAHGQAGARAEGSGARWVVRVDPQDTEQTVHLAVPFAHFWQTSAGTIQEADGRVAVTIPAGTEEVVVSVATRRLNAGLMVSIFVLLLSLLCWGLTFRRR